MHRKLTFTIADSPVHWRTHRIMELCEHLTTNVLEPLFQQDGTHWDRRFSNFFSFDNGCDPLEATGTIRLQVPPLLVDRVGQLRSAIQNEFARLKIKTAPFVCEKDSFGAVRSIVIRVSENPTALGAPPEVNMSQTRGYVVLRDLLGYQRVNGRYEFNADDLVKRASSITEEKIADCTASPVNNGQTVRRTPSAASMKAVRRCLEEIKQFGNWALTHNYRKLAAV